MLTPLQKYGRLVIKKGKIEISKLVINILCLPEMFFMKLSKQLCKKKAGIFTHDPFPISVGGVDMSIDLGAERLIAAEKQSEKIAVEVKSFLAKSSAISEFHRALGQFINYRAALKEKEPDRILYLAVPLITYEEFFQLDFPKARVEENQLRMIVYDTAIEVIVKWKN